ncbi:MAG: hypothetical protein CM1200mP21_00780 [Candidatus Poseidoniales archaeon]|nr:MAG: hypothetical protein CM1200mP21_00780 [Candidatus Poseidoniales archaeon]
MIEIENIQEIGAGTAIVGLLIAFMLYNKINKIEISNPIVADITQQIQNGAMAFLNAEYRYLAIFIAVGFLQLCMSIRIPDGRQQ